jgi:hypothetical protein
MSRDAASDHLMLVPPREDPPRTDVPTAGVLVGHAHGCPLVRLEHEPEGVRRVAHTVVALEPAHVGRRVVVAFLDADIDRPVITGLLSEGEAEPPRRREIAAEELLLRGEREITLVCGEARITLTRDGRIVIRGVDLLSRVSGSHRIRAGSISLN